MPSSHEQLIYAIDFGTSNSLVAAASHDQILPPVPLSADTHLSGSDQTILRSIWYTPSAGTWYFGNEAIQRYGEFNREGRIFRSIKRFLPDPAFESTQIHGKTYRIVDLIALFLRELRDRANRHLQQDVTSVVLGKPAVYSTNPEKEALACQRMVDAAKLAGFTEVSFCPEPVAAAHEFRSQLLEPQTVLIADFGGGTSDFTVLRMDRNGFAPKDILAIGGISVAGDAFDGSLMKNFISPYFGANVTYRMPLGSNELTMPSYLVNKLCSPADISFLARQDVMRLLKDAKRWSLKEEDAERMNNLFTLVEENLSYELFREIENTKKQLSSKSSSFFSFDHTGINIREEIFSTDFQALAHPLVEQIVRTLDETMKDAGVSYDEVDIVCCTGGTAQLPALRQALGRRFGEEKLRQFKHFHSVIEGLAVHAQQLLK